MGLWQKFISAIPFAGVVSGNEVPAPKGKRTLVASVADDLPIFRQFQRIGGAVTPAQFSRYLASADAGYIGPIISMAMESRQKDGHLQGILGQREDSLQELEWEFYYPGADRDSTRGRRQIRFLEEQTDNNPEFARLIANLSGDFYFGWSATEIVYRKDGKYLVLDVAKPLDPRRGGYALRDGRLIFRDDPTAAFEEIRFEDFEPGKWVVSKRRINGDVERREGAMRVLLWAALFRNWSLSDWLKLAEIAWKPYRVVRYDKNGFTQEDRNDLEAFLEDLTSSGIMMVPKDVELDVMWPQGQGSQSNHSNLHQAMGREMSKAVLGQDGTTEQSATSGYAQVKVQERVSDKKVGADARSASHFVTQQWVRPLIAMNFGEQADCPSFRLKIARPVDVTKVAGAISTLSNSGLRIPAKWARAQIGAPEPKDGEELVSDGKPEPVAPGAKPDSGLDPQEAKDQNDSEGEDAKE